MFENIPPHLQEGVISDLYSAINRYNQQTEGLDGARKLDYDIYDVNNPPPSLTKEQMAAGVKPKPILATKDANGKYHLNVSAPEYAALQVLAKQKAFKTGGYVFDEKATELEEKRREGKAKIDASEALARERRERASLLGKKASAVDKQFNPAQTFDELFKGKMETYRTEKGQVPVTRVNVKNMSKAFVDNLGIAPINSDGDYNVVPENIIFKGKEIPEAEIYGMYNRWLSTDAAKELQEKTKKAPDVFDFIYKYGGNFDVAVEGKIAPKYGIDKTTGRPIVLNPDEAGKFLRSNKLQSWINQSKGAKNKSLLMSEEQETTEESSDEAVTQ